MSNAAHALLLGRKLGNKYVIEHLIGTGGMGAVYRARQIALDKWVAVKILHRDLAGEPKFVARFQREALSASRLDHPNSLRVLDYGEDGGVLYLVLEYVDAEDLLAVMNREWPFADERVVHMLSQVLAALAVAHDFGIVHRDLKPENILVLRSEDDDGVPTDLVKVCDFGVAKLEPRGACLTSSLAPHVFGPHLTVDGLAIGTPDYMSPEQARGESVDGRSDIYSLGVVLYHLLAGRPPFVSESALGVALQHVSDQPTPPSKYRDVDPLLEAICLRALAKRPEDRFQSAREMRRALRAAMQRAPRSSSSTPPLVLTRDPVVTPPLGTSPPAGVTLNPAEPALFTRSRRRPRARRAFGATIGVAVMALLGAASSPTVRHSIDQRLPKRFEVVQTVAAAMGDAPHPAPPETLISTLSPVDAATVPPIAPSIQSPIDAPPDSPQDVVPPDVDRDAGASTMPPRPSRSHVVTPAASASASQPAPSSSSEWNRGAVTAVTARAGLPGTTVRPYTP